MNKELLAMVMPEPTESEIREACQGVREELGFDIERALFPVNPLKIEPSISIEEAKALSKHWHSVRHSVRGSVRDSARAYAGYSVGDSVWDSVGDSVWDSVRGSVWYSVWYSVWDSVWDSVRHSVRHSVRDSVWDSVRDSVRAYESSIYFGVTGWKGVDHKAGENPFQSAIDLWEAGYVSSFDGKTTRLHTKNGIAWEGVINKEGKK